MVALGSGLPPSSAPLVGIAEPLLVDDDAPGGGGAGARAGVPAIAIPPPLALLAHFTSDASTLQPPLHLVLAVRFASPPPLLPALRKLTLFSRLDADGTRALASFLGDSTGACVGCETALCPLLVFA